MLGRYMLQFDDCRMLEAGLRESGFEAHYHAFFFGCATAIVGRKNQVVEDGTGTVK
jgi:hypothetical protein